MCGLLFDLAELSQWRRQGEQAKVDLSQLHCSQPFTISYSPKVFNEPTLQDPKVYKAAQLIRQSLWPKKA